MPALARAKQHSIEAPPLEDRIWQRAYELYVQRAGESGFELDDWLQAEQETLREEKIDEASEESFPASDPPAY